MSAGRGGLKRPTEALRYRRTVDFSQFEGATEMKSHQKIAMALIAGVAIGVAAIQGLHAQAKPTAYVVVAIRSITDAEGLKTVAEKAPAIIAAAGGHPLVATNAITSLDGKPPQRFVHSIEKAKAWYDMPAMKELTAMRIKSTD